MTSGKLGKTYPNTKYGNNPSNIKSIRVTKEQEMNWDPDLIRSVLEGSHKSNDSIRISTLKDYLKGLYDIMANKMNPKASLDQNEKELLIKISEVVGNE